MPPTAALAAFQAPRDVAWWPIVRTASGTRRCWRGSADEPVNPASLMKLLTTVAALDMLGAGLDAGRTPVWLTRTVRGRRARRRSLVIKGSGDPKLVVERVWLLLRRVQELGVREIRGDIVLDRSAFGRADRRAGRLRRRAAAPVQRARRCAAAELPFGGLHASFPTRRAASRVMLAEPPLAGDAVDAQRARWPPARATTGAAALKADFIDPRRRRASPAATRRPAASSAGRSPTPSPAPTTRALLDAHVARDRRPPHRHRARRLRADGLPPTFEIGVAAAGRRRPRHQQVQQQRDGAAAVPDARRCSATRQRHARRGARGAARNGPAQRLGEPPRRRAEIDNGSGLSRNDARSARRSWPACCCSRLGGPGDARADVARCRSPASTARCGARAPRRAAPT